MATKRESSEETDAPTAAVGTVSRVIQVMRFVAETRGETSPRALAAGLGLPVSTSHRMLSLLSDEGIVTRSSRNGYVPGLEFRRIAQFVSERLSIVDVARKGMRRTVDLTGESCALGIYQPGDRVVEFVAVEESSNPLTYRVPLNRPEPVYLGASGKAILAFLPPEDVEVVLDRDLPATAADGGATRDFLDRTRERGWCWTRSEKLVGAVGIAAPIFGATSRVVGCLCITIPESRFDENRTDEMGEVVAAESRSVSRELGWAAT